MKFWKLSILSTLVLSVFVIFLFTTTSCEKNACDNVTCFNGGSCNVGKCLCPVGYEGTQCENKATARFEGVYAGLTTCNNGAYLLDSAWIAADPAKINYVYVTFKSLLPKILHGYVYNNESVYSIIVPEEHSTDYQKIYTITLQGDQTLSIHTYSKDDTHPGLTLIDKCDFLGTKH